MLLMPGPLFAFGGERSLGVNMVKRFVTSVTIFLEGDGAFCSRTVDWGTGGLRFIVFIRNRTSPRVVRRTAGFCLK